jgi:hypothetical protein
MDPSQEIAENRNELTVMQTFEACRAHILWLEHLLRKYQDEIRKNIRYINFYGVGDSDKCCFWNGDWGFMFGWNWAWGLFEIGDSCSCEIGESRIGDSPLFGIEDSCFV